MRGYGFVSLPHSGGRISSFEALHSAFFWPFLNTFTAGWKPVSGTKSLGNGIGMGFGVLNGLRSWICSQLKKKVLRGYRLVSLAQWLDFLFRNASFSIFLAVP